MGEQTPPGSLRMHSTVLMNFANNRCTPTPSVKTEIICAPGHHQFRRDLSKHNYCRWRSASGFPRTSHLITLNCKSHVVLLFACRLVGVVDVRTKFKGKTTTCINQLILLLRLCRKTRILLTIQRWRVETRCNRRFSDWKCLRKTFRTLDPSTHLTCGFSE